MRTNQKNKHCKNCKRRYIGCHGGCDKYEQPTYSNDFSNADIADYMRTKMTRLRKIYSR